mmetsp:Transcript_68781/g.110855  ORF Transcript_68781/g.110855 Transcript_68781/m.110855 type:complete len:322 (-) Transcript_68781:41-1006(-)
MPLPTLGAFDTAQFGCLHDAQYDSSGRRLTTASSDGVVRLWCAERHELLQELRGHQAAVLALSWASGRTTAAPLASGAADGSISIWREDKKTGGMRAIHQLFVKGPVTGLAFCPPEYGLLLAVGGESGGEVCILTRREVTASPVLPAGEVWQAKTLLAHDGGIVDLSFAPAASPATLAAGPAAVRAAVRGPFRLATAGTDGRLRVWRCDEKTASWTLQQDLLDPTSGSRLRCVAWRPNIGLPSSTIAVGSEDGSVQVWVQDMEGQPWNCQASWKVDGDTRRLSWSKAGVLLAVSAGDAGSMLFKEGPVGSWSQVGPVGSCE